VAKKIIGKINEGVVIDHIPAGEVWKIVNLLGIDKRNGRISLGDGYETFREDKDHKGILKIEGMNLTQKQLNYVALIAEDVTVNRIEDGKVVKKIELKIPRNLEGVVRCIKLSCISNLDREGVKPKIKYSKLGGFTCEYCDVNFGRDEIKFYGF